MLLLGFFECRPDEGLRLVIVLGDEADEIGFKLIDGSEHTALDGIDFRPTPATRPLARRMNLMRSRCRIEPNWESTLILIRRSQCDSVLAELFPLSRARPAAFF